MVKLLVLFLSSIIYLTAVEHPYIIWTQADIDRMRQQHAQLVESDATYKARLSLSLDNKRAGGSPALRELFKAVVLQNDKALQQQIKYLMRFAGANPNHIPHMGGRHFDNSMQAVRYDVLYHHLTDDQRAKLEATFRVFIDHHMNDKKNYTRTSWLPNMQWPRPMAAHLMAVALGEKETIESIAASNGGWRYYMDEYLTDGMFYNEEFGKQYSMIGTMYLWCEGLKNLGMNELGYGYVGKNGGTMRRYIDGIIRLSFPAVSLGGSRDHYPLVTMGDASGAPKNFRPGKKEKGPDHGAYYMLNHAFVTGYMADGKGGERWWTGNNMNGRDITNAKVQKFGKPLWYEVAHKNWPDGGYDWVLQQMRSPEQEMYLPTLFFGLNPFTEKPNTPPSAPSTFSNERGFVMMRSDESQNYWQSSAPAVALNLGRYYVHHVSDYLSILGYYSYNRPIYMQRNVAAGYATNCPWTGHGRGKNTVVVDNMQPLHRGDGMVPMYDASTASSKAVIVTYPGRFKGVDEAKALVLTSRYLLDVHHIQADQERTIDYQIQAVGWPDDSDGLTWTASNDLADNALYMREGMVRRAKQAAHQTDDYPTQVGKYSHLIDLRRVEKHEAHTTPITFRFVQCANPKVDASTTALGAEWYQREVGVRATILATEGSIAYRGLQPTSLRTEPIVPENGGYTGMVRRRAAQTTFVSVHEPFEHNAPTLDRIEAIHTSDTAVGVRVMASDGSVNDRVFVSLTLDDQHQPQRHSVQDDQDAATFTGHARVQIQAQQILIHGQVHAFSFTAAANKTVLLNGTAITPNFADGVYSWAQ